MTDAARVQVDSATGPVHAGNGDQYVTIGGILRESDKPSFRRVADDQLSWLRRVLVPPPGMGRARARLTGTGTVLLDGAPGVGRTATARVLLRELDGPEGVFRELLPEEGETSLRDPTLVGAGDRLLLDLSQIGADRWAALGADLSTLRQTVQEKNAHLVVVMPHAGALDSDLQHYRVELRRPPGLAVFRRHLRVHGLPSEEYLRSDGTVNEIVRESRPLREIADFADLVRRARENAAPGSGFGRWCLTARRARKDRRDEIAARVSGLREESQRALLFTVAMLHGAHADVIHQSVRLLLAELRSPPDEAPLLQRKDLAERLAEISAAVDASGHVRFTELDYDRAVSAHFWDHIPDLRDGLGNWAARTAELADPHMTRELRDRLVERLAAQCLRTDRQDRLAALVEQWSAANASRVRLEAAVHALTCGLQDPRRGAQLRRIIYQWCAFRRLKGELAQVLVQVCADVISSSHPDQALVRLHHLALRERGSRRAREALASLVETDRRLRRRLLDRLMRAPDQAEVALIFLDIADPRALTSRDAAHSALIEEHGVRRSLTDCWQRTLRSRERPEWHARAVEWLRVGATADPDGGPLVDILVEAADRSGENRGAGFAALYASAREAELADAGGPAAEVATTGLLLRRISAAQGLAAGTPPRHAASAGRGRI